MRLERFSCRRWRRRPELSILIPFQAPRGSDRARILKWIKRYCRHTFPKSEVIVGHAHGFPFSKTQAVNDAARRARGKVYIILDADAYFDPHAIREALERLREAHRRGRRLWMIPYRHLYRLTYEATEEVLESSPRHPFHFCSPPPPEDIEHIHSPNYGHHYAAMIMIMPAEAFWLVGGMDPRFAGWGAEDVCWMHALDTLWGPHRTLDKDLFHLYHRKIGRGWASTQWPNQTTKLPNSHLAMRYGAARRDKQKMRALVDEYRVEPK